MGLPEELLCLVYSVTLLLRWVPAPPRSLLCVPSALEGGDHVVYQTLSRGNRAWQPKPAGRTQPDGTCAGVAAELRPLKWH